MLLKDTNQVVGYVCDICAHVSMGTTCPITWENLGEVHVCSCCTPEFTNLGGHRAPAEEEEVPSGI